MKAIRTAAAAATAPFAHLLGLGNRAQKEDKEDKEKDREARRARKDGESDDEYAKRMKEEDAREEKEDAKAEEERKEDDDARGKGKTGKKGEKADEDEDEDGDEEEKEMRASGPASEARARERRRCAAIFTSAAAGARPDVAAHLAFETTMSRTAAIAMLETVSAGAPPKSSRRPLDARMSGERIPNVGTGGAAAAPGTPEALAARMMASYNRATGKSTEAART